MSLLGSASYRALSRVTAQLNCRPCTRPRQVTWLWGPTAPPVSSPLLSGRSLHPTDPDELAGPPHAAALHTVLPLARHPALPPLRLFFEASLASSFSHLDDDVFSSWASFLEAVCLGPFPLHLAVNWLRAGPGSCLFWRCLDAGLGYMFTRWIGGAGETVDGTGCEHADYQKPSQ